MAVCTLYSTSQVPSGAAPLGGTTGGVLVAQGRV